MFGHDETTKNNDENTNPEHDGVLDDAAATTTAPSNSDSPAFIMTKPASDNSKTDAPLPEPKSAPAPAGDLLDIKQSALKMLTPLVGHLNQTPEEKFRTTMMMIQASDDQALIKDAYAAAQGISDEKVKAQALLDIINEINYFTQQS